MGSFLFKKKTCCSWLSCSHLRLKVGKVHANISPHLINFSGQHVDATLGYIHEHLSIFLSVLRKRKNFNEYSKERFDKTKTDSRYQVSTHRKIIHLYKTPKKQNKKTSWKTSTLRFSDNAQQLKKRDILRCWNYGFNRPSIARLEHQYNRPCSCETNTPLFHVIAYRVFVLSFSPACRIHEMRLYVQPWQSALPGWWNDVSIEKERLDRCWLLSLDTTACNQ